MEKLLDEAEYLDVWEVRRFLRIEDNQDDEEELSSDRLKELRLSEFFASGLKDARVYNLDFAEGEHYTVHYALGQTKEGDWIGVVTDSFTW